jgi:hypothetical protein
MTPLINIARYPEYTQWLQYQPQGKTLLTYEEWLQHHK